MSEIKEIKSLKELVELFGQPRDNEFGVIAAYQFLTQPGEHEDEEK